MRLKIINFLNKEERIFELILSGWGRTVTIPVREVKYQILLVLNPYSAGINQERTWPCLLFVPLIRFFKVKLKCVSISDFGSFYSVLTTVRLNTNFAYCSSIWWNIQQCIFRCKFLNTLASNFCIKYY